MKQPTKIASGPSGIARQLSTSSPKPREIRQLANAAKAAIQKLGVSEHRRKWMREYMRKRRAKG